MNISIDPERDSYTCLVAGCGTVFNTQKNLDIHVGRVHKERKFTCSVCSKSFPTTTGLAQHTARQHRTLQKFQCAQCGRGFAYKSGLQTHENEHVTKPYTCSTCQTLFKTNDELQSHIVVEHAKPAPAPHPEPPDESKPFKCTRCERWFADAKGVQGHERTVHDGTTVSCPTCNKTFKNSKTLKEHLARHKDKMKFNCSKCPKSFASKGTRDRHERLKHANKTTGDADEASSLDEAESADDTEGNIEYAEEDRQGENKELAESHEEAIASTPIRRDMTNSKSEQSPQEVTESHEQAVSNSSNSEDFVDTDDRHSLQELRRGLFSEEAVQRVTSMLTEIRDKFALSMVMFLPETPSPAQQLTMGRNLRSFEQCQLVEPLSTLIDPDIEPSKNLRNLLVQPSRRKLYSKLMKKSSAKYYEILRVQNFDGSIAKTETDELHDLDITRFRLDQGRATVLAKYAQELLEKMPVLLGELSFNHRNWILSVANRFASNEQADVKISLPMPQYKMYLAQGKERYYVAFHVSGYDHRKCHPWNKQINIPLSANIDTSADIDIPEEKRISWEGLRLPIPQAGLEQYGEANFTKTMRVAQRLTLYYSGFIGTFEECKRDAVLKYSNFMTNDKVTSRYRKQGMQRVAPANVSWSGQPIWILEIKATYSAFAPSAWLLGRMQGAPSYHIIHTVETERLFSIANGMLMAIVDGCNEDTVWGIGAMLADEANRCGKEAAPVLTACKDTNHTNEIHVCPACLRLRAHQDLHSNEYRYYPICKDCIDEFQGLGRKAGIKGGVVGFQLLAAYKRENEVVEQKETPAQLKKKTNDTIDALQFMCAPDGFQWYDGYVDCLLNPKRNKPLTWDKVKLHPLVPSVEAIDPVVSGKDNLTHYHYFDSNLNNIVVIGDWVNRVKQHHQVVVLHALLLFAEAPSRGKKIYEQAIAVMRNCLINHYEYGFMGHAQHARRIGKPVPPNMAAISRSFRTAELLDRTKPVEMVWRMYGSRPLGPLQQRASWRPPNFQWLSTQLGYIEAEVFGNDAQFYRKYWMRCGADGHNVFWPFSQYSVTLDCTWWGLWEILAVKDVRNVTVCQVPHSGGKQLKFYHIEELFLVIANLWLRMIKKDIDNGFPSYDYGRDEAGLIPHPNINTLLCASLGHARAGETQHTGLRSFDLNKPGKVHFDAEKCGFVWETQLTNFMKFKYNECTFADMFSLLKKIRRGNLLPQETRNLLPPQDLQLTLRDELNAVTSAQDTRIGCDYATTIPDDPTTFRALLGLIAKQQAQGLSLLSTGTDREQTTSAITNLGAVQAHSTTVQVDQSEDQFEEDDDYWNTILLDSAFEAALVKAEQPINTAPRCQLSNLSATCYMSSVIHILANTPEIMAGLMSFPKLIPLTGRDPRILQDWDADGTKHTELINTVAATAKKLLQEGSSLSLGETLKILQASHDLNPRWENANSDAGEYFLFMMDALDVISDNSPFIQQQDVNEMQEAGAWIRRPAYRPAELLHQKRMVDLSAGVPPISLHEDANQDWDAHALSGHQSKFTESTGIQLVLLSQCDSEKCPGIKREFRYSSAIQLRFPPHLVSTEAIPLEQLMEQSFLEDLDPAPECPNKELHKKTSDGRLSSRLTRIGRVGKVFAVEIIRTRPQSKLPEGLSSNEKAAFFQNLADDPFMNRLEDFEIIDMDTWANGRDITEKPHLNEMAPQTEELAHVSVRSQYQVCAIIVYSRAALHYTAFVKVEDRWTYFDDLQAHPVYRDPFTDWPEGYVERLLLYKNVEPMNAPEHTGDAMSTTIPEASKLSIKQEAARIESFVQPGPQLPTIGDATEVPSLFDQWLAAMPENISYHDIVKLHDIVGSMFKRSTMPHPPTRTSHRRTSAAMSSSSDDSAILASSPTRKSRRMTPFTGLMVAASGSSSKKPYASQKETETAGDKAVQKRSSLGNLLSFVTTNRPRDKTAVESVDIGSTMAVQKRRDGIPQTPTARLLSTPMRFFSRRRSSRRVPTPVTVVHPRTDTEGDGFTSGSLTDVTAPGSPTPLPMIDRKADRRRDQLLLQDQAGSKVQSREQSPSRTERTSAQKRKHGQTRVEARKEPDQLGGAEFHRSAAYPNLSGSTAAAKPVGTQGQPILVSSSEMEFDADDRDSADSR